MSKSAIPNVNCLWGEITARVLARLGLRHVVIAPGSRSAPLVWGFTRQENLEAIPVLDERSAAFYALGLAKASGQPVALVCTSGTAAANFFPAIIEAHYSAVPLLVLTADRPPELRDCHAGQAIDQVKLYGHYPRWQHELALPENRPEMLRYLRQTLVHAWERAQQPWPGPVHLNFPFREPLAPVVEGKPIARSVAESLVARVGQSTSWRTAVIFAADTPALRDRLELAKRARRGVVIVGPMEPQHPRPVELLAEGWGELGWPVLTDALNPLRHLNRHRPETITHYDAVLRNSKKQKALTPDFVLQIGPLPASKVLRAWLKDCDVPTLIIQPHFANADPLHRDALHWHTPAFSAVKVLGTMVRKGRDTKTYAEHWRERNASVAQGIAKKFAKLDWLFEGKAAWLLSQKLPWGTPVFAASSMPVRDCECFWEAGRGQVFYFNRGANGIDGTLSTALGVAHATKQPAVLYTGDLALLHDQNGFLAAKELPEGASLTIVCVNNNGGGIFEHLPIAQFEPPFERFFATPQNVDFRKLAALHNLDYHCPATWPEFEQALLPLPKRGVRLIELRTDRKRDAAFRAKLFREIADKL